MGFRISWIGFQGHSKSEVLKIMGLVDTGVVDEANESSFCGAEIPGGWYIVFANDFEFVTRKRLQSMSRHGVVIACQVHEGVMVSAAYGYDQGVEQWALLHNSENGIRDLDVSGSPPLVFEEVRSRLSRAQEENGGASAGVDYFFDIPVETVEAICGYTHNRWKFEWGQPMFSVLEPDKSNHDGSTRAGKRSVVRAILDKLIRKR